MAAHIPVDVHTEYDGPNIIDEDTFLKCQESEKRWRCPVASCGKVLSRKQTLKSHVVSIHRLECAVPVKPYKQYEKDPSAEVPRATIYYKKRKIHTEDIVLEGEPSQLETEETEVGIDTIEYLDMDIDEDTVAEKIGTDAINHGYQVNEKNIQEPEVKPHVPLYIVKCNQCQNGLYKSRISQSEHELAVLSFTSRHNLSDNALEDLLTLLSLHLPQNNLVQTDINILKERCGFDSKFLKNFVFCNVCENTIPNGSELCGTPNCTGGKSASRNKSFFMTGDLKLQLTEMLQKEGVWDAIQERTEKTTACVTDILDGEEYKKLKMDGQFLKDPNNITLTLFTDGIPLFKSSGVSLWPVYLLVNELPRHERFRRKNMLLWGVWQGTGKPVMTVYLKELVIDLQDMYRNGIIFKFQNEAVKTRAMLLVATMDLQARAAVLKMTQHNGEYACIFCLEKGKQVKTGKGHCKVFPYSENTQLRTSEGIRKDSSDAQVQKIKVNGFFGESAFLYLPEFELNINLVVDYMHGILLGIVKKFITMWFESSFSKQPYYIGNKVKSVDKSLANITPPYSITRLPRKIQNTFHHWKASEMRAWLLFYSLPCLWGILPEVYLKHFSLLVEATFILLREGITNRDMERAEMLLKTFCRTAADLYGESLLGLNMHNLLHLTMCVKRWGPLWAWSCFCFESFNGQIKKNVHGTGNVCIQIFWALLAEKHIERASASITNESVADFIKNQTGSFTMTQDLTTAPCFVRKKYAFPVNFVFPKAVREKLLQFTGKSSISSFSKAKRIHVNGRYIYSKNQSKVKKRNSYTVSIIDKKHTERVLEIDYFVVDNVTLHVYAVGQELTGGTPLLPGNAHNIKRYPTRSLEQSVEKAMDIQELLVSFEVNTDRYICRLPNTVEGD